MGIPGRVVWHDDFTQANSTSPTSTLWTTSATSATVNIQSNQLRLALTGSIASFGEFATVYATSPIPVPNFEITTDITISAITEMYPSINLGNGTASSNTPQQNGYALIIDRSHTTLKFARYDGNSEVTLSSDTGYSLAASTVLHVRWRVEGYGHYVRVWQAAADEPTDWKFTATDATYNTFPSRRVGFGILSGAAAAAKNANFDFVTVREIVEGRPRKRGVR